MASTGFGIRLYSLIKVCAEHQKSGSESQRDASTVVPFATCPLAVAEILSQRNAGSHSGYVFLLSETVSYGICKVEAF